MNHLLQLAAAHSATPASALVDAAWQGTLLVLLTLAGLRLVPALSAAARSFVWLAALLLLVGLNLAPLLATHPAGNVPSSTLLHADGRWSLALAGVWMTLSLLRAIQLLRSVVALHGLARRSKPLPVQPAALLRLGRTTIVQLCASPDVDRPSVVGFFAPKVLLPADLAVTLPPAELAPILCHEMEHLRRRDDWTNLLQKLALVLFPLSPALLWVDRRLCAERELACDDGVLRATGARKAYATSLAGLAEHSLLRRSLSLALGAWDRRPELELRIRRILQPATQRMGAGQTATAVVGLLLVTGATSLVATRAPQLIGFQTATSRTADTPAIATATLAPAPRATAAHLTLASAAMPRRSGKIHTPFRRIAQLAPRRHSARLTLTRWHTDAQTQPTASAPEFVLAYAAVRVPDGWLIIQL